MQSTRLTAPGIADPANHLPKRISRYSGSTKPLKLSIIIPCYNEAATLPTIVNKIIAVPLHEDVQKQIIIVNDSSTDDTDLIIQNYIIDQPSINILYTKHTRNQGKGAAIQTGIQMATGDFLIIQDADLEYDPIDYNAMLLPVLTGHADVVYGSRFTGGNPHRILFFWHTLGNRLLTFISNALSNLNLTDMETGYKLFKTSIIQQISLKEKRFGFEPEITIKISKLPDIKIYEVGISYYGRTYKEGKKIRLKDAFRCIFCLLKYSLLSDHSTPKSDKVKLPNVSSVMNQITS